MSVSQEEETTPTTTSFLTMYGVNAAKGLSLSDHWDDLLAYILAHPSTFSEEKGVTQDHVAEVMEVCLEHRHVDVVLTAVLRDAPVKVLQTKDSQGNLLLHKYCGHDCATSIEVLHILVQRFPESLAMTSKDGETALRMEVRKGDEGFVRYLLQCHIEFGFSIDPTFPWLIHCCWSGMPLDIFSMVLTLAPLNASVRDGKGSLPLHLACELRSQNRALEVFQRILEAYPKAAEIPDTNGSLPIHAAASDLQRIECLNALVNTYPKGLQIHDQYHMLPLHWALRYCKHGADDDHDIVNDLNCLLDPSGCRELNRADGTQAILAILQSGSTTHSTKLNWLYDTFPSLIRQADGNGELPLHVVCRGRHQHRCRISTIHTVSSRFPDAWNVFDDNGYLPLHHLCMGLSYHTHIQGLLHFALTQRGSALPPTRDGTPALLAACEFLPKRYRRNNSDLDAIFELVRLSLDLFVHRALES